MKFVYCGYDFMLPCAHALQADGHELGGILTFPCDNTFNFNRETIALANDRNLPALIEKPKLEHIQYLLSQGIECFISAGYLYKIPDVAPAYGLNIHPSYLPKGRGMMPAPYILLDHPEASGFTIHKLAANYDAGDILYQQKLRIGEHETVETLSERTLTGATKAIVDIMRDLPRHWKNAKPQNEKDASTFPPPDNTLRTLDWALPIERLDKIARAFGHYGSLATLDNTKYAVFAHTIKKAKHSNRPGAVMARTNDQLTVAAKDGYFIITKFQKI